MDIMLALDESTSIVDPSAGGLENWEKHMLGFATDIAKSFEIGPNDTQIALLKFSTSFEIEFYLDTYDNQTAVIQAIQELDINGGETDIAAALRVTREVMFSPSHGARSGVSKVLIVVTDGRSGRGNAILEASTTKEAGIEIFVVGVTSNVDGYELQQIASGPTNLHVYFVETFDQLSNIVQPLVGLNETCSTMPISARTTSTTTTRPTAAATNTFSTPSTTSSPGEFPQLSAYLEIK